MCGPRGPISARLDILLSPALGGIIHMSDRQTTGGRITKAERKEQARRERLELQRKIARTKRNRRIVLGLSILVVAAVTVFALTRPSTAVATPSELLGQAAAAKQAAGCGSVDNVGPYRPEAQDQAHVTTEEMPPLSDYPSVPPTSGPHNAVPLGAGVYDSPPPIDRLIHSLEHGAAVIWYAPGATGAEIDGLREFYADANVGARVIVAPYDYPAQGAAGSLPAGTQMALVAWHNLEPCAQVNLAAAFDFTARYTAPPFGQQEYLGEAPEPGAAF